MPHIKITLHLCDICIQLFLATGSMHSYIDVGRLDKYCCHELTTKMKFTPSDSDDADQEEDPK